MSPKKSPTLPKAGDQKELVVQSFPSHSAQLRQLVIGIGTAVTLTLAGVGGYAWYVAQKNQEEAAKVLKAKKRALAALRAEKKIPKVLTKEEKKFVQNSKKLTLSENGDIVLFTTFSPEKITQTEEEPPKKDVPVKKEIPPTQAKQETVAKAETPSDATKTPSSNIIGPDGRLRLTGKPGEAEALRKILESAWDPSAREKSKK